MRNILITTLLFAAVPAFAHDVPPSKSQPLGWTYGAECCSLMDCFSLSEGAVFETHNGYVIKATQELIPYSDRRIHRSKDEFYHQCTTGGDHHGPHSICLYVPDRGY